MADSKWTRLTPVIDKIVPLLANALVGQALLDKLCAGAVVSCAQYNELLRYSQDPSRSRESVARELFSILSRRPHPSFDSFCAVLQEEEGDEDRKAIYDLLVTSATGAQTLESTRLPCENLPAPEDKTPIVCDKKRALGTAKNNSSEPPSKKEGVDYIASTTTGVAQAQESGRLLSENFPAYADETQIVRGGKCAHEDSSDHQAPSKTVRADFTTIPVMAFILVHNDLRDKWESDHESCIHIVNDYCTLALPERKILLKWHYVSKMTFSSEGKSDCYIPIDKEECLLRIIFPKTEPEVFEEYRSQLFGVMSCLLTIKKIEIIGGSCRVKLTVTGKGFINFICGLHAASNFAHLIIFDSLATLQIGSLPPVKLVALLRSGQLQSMPQALSGLQKNRIFCSLKSHLYAAVDDAELCLASVQEKLRNATKRIESLKINLTFQLGFQSCLKLKSKTLLLKIKKRLDAVIKAQVILKNKIAATAKHFALKTSGVGAPPSPEIDHCGVNFNEQDNYDLTSLMLACRNGHLDTVQLLLSKQCDIKISKDGWTALNVASFYGQTAVTEYLINHFGVNVNEQNNDGWTSLMMACQEGHLDTVQLLVSKQCDINIRKKNGGTALHVASSIGQTAVTEYLIDHCGVNVNEQDYYDLTSLMLACRNGHLDTVQLLVSRQCDIEISKDGWTALHVASFYGRIAVTEYLINHCGVNVNEQNNDGWTSLMMACQEGHLDIVQLLVSKQCDTNIRTKDGSTALHVASSNGQTAVTEYLINHCGANVNDQDNDGCTSLMCACYESHLDIVQLLVSNIRTKDGWTALNVASFYGQTAVTEYLINHCGVNVNEQNNDGWTSLMMACQEGHLDTVQLLVSKQCDINIRKKNGGTALHVASSIGQTAVTEYLIDHCGVNVNEQDYYDLTSLMLACRNGHLDTVQLLVSRQCDIEISKDGWTALHVASFYGRIAVTEYLINHCGVNVNEQNNDCLTSLMMACQEGHLDIVQLLVSKQCDTNIRTKDGSTALHVASSNGQTAVTEYLINHCGANVNDQDNDGCTSLMMACQEGLLDTVQLLISKQCDMNIRDEEGWTALHFASFNGQTAVTEYLIDHCGVNVNEKNNDGWTSLMMACQKGHLDTVQLLVSKQCDINIRYKDGRTALHVASHYGQTAVTEYLIDHSGVNVDDQDNDGWTSLMIACQKGHLDTVQLLVSKQCDINIRTKFGKTALFLSCSGGQNDIADFLIKKKGLTFAQNSHDVLLAALRNCRFSSVQQLASCVLFDKMTVVNDVLLTRRNERDYNFSEHQLLSLLLARGASASVKSKHGKLPYEYASGESRRILKHAWLESQYAELSVMGYSSPSRIKVCVIGDERAGKSTLIRSLQQSLLGALARSIFGQDDPDRTAGIKFEEANIDSAGELVFCDFGGQKDFHKTHSLFFSSATVFVLVIDLSRPWNEILKSGFYWLSFTKCSLLVSADSKARLILVGSRGEQVGQTELLKWLSRSLKAKFSKWFDISDEQFVLDCRSPRTQTMDSIKAHLGQLKQQCMKSAKKVPSIVEKVESDLLPLVRKLLLSSEHPLQALAKAKNLLPEQLSSVIRQLLCNEDQCSEEGTTILSDFELTVDKIQRTDRHCIPCGLLLAMIDKTVFPGLRKDVQTQILKFLHTYSSIIVFEEEDVLVVNPNWLCYNVIGPLMSPKEFPIHMTPTTNGIFSLEDIRVTLKEFSKSQKTRLTDVNEAIKILCRLEICYPLPYNSHKFQFPALIQEERPADAWMNNADKPVYVGRRLQCDNDTDIITPGTMPFFQAHVAAGLGSPDSVSSLSPIVWKGGIKTFESVRGLRFETLVELTENERAIDIIVRGPMYSAAECYKLVQETKTRVEEMLDQRSPGTDLFELVLSCKDMKNLAEPRHGYSCEEIECAKSDDEYPKVSLDSTSEEYVSDLIAVPDDHVNVVLPCEVKRYMHNNFSSTSLVPQSMASSLGMRRTHLSSTFSADSVFIQWSQRMDATLPTLIKALKETEQTDLLDMFEEEGLVPIEINLEVASASDDSENLAIEDNEGELSGACFMPREEVDMHYEGKSTVKKSDDDDEVVKDHHIETIKNKLFDDHDDVVSFGMTVLGWSRAMVLDELSDRPDRRIGHKVSVLLHCWKDQVESPTISMLLSYLKKFDKEGIAIQLLKSCKKP